MSVEQFFDSLEQHCAAQSGCETCCVRLFCYAPPVEKTAYMVHEATVYLAQSGIADHAPSDHRISDRMQKCPLELEMSYALGGSKHE